MLAKYFGTAWVKAYIILQCLQNTSVLRGLKRTLAKLYLLANYLCRIRTLKILISQSAKEITNKNDMETKADKKKEVKYEPTAFDDGTSLLFVTNIFHI